MAVVTKLWPKGTEPWNRDCFMKPVIEDDAMLLLGKIAISTMA